jgi:hypothetical protein
LIIALHELLFLFHLLLPSTFYLHFDLDIDLFLLNAVVDSGLISKLLHHTRFDRLQPIVGLLGVGYIW